MFTQQGRRSQHYELNSMLAPCWFVALVYTSCFRKTSTTEETFAKRTWLAILAPKLIECGAPGPFVHLPLLVASGLLISLRSASTHSA